MSFRCILIHMDTRFYNSGKIIAFTLVLLAAILVALFAWAVPAKAEGITLSPSGDTTGVTDRKAFQAALDAGGAVTLDRGNYYIDKVVVIKQSGTAINAAGATITQITPGTGLVHTFANGAGGWDAVSGISINGGWWVGSSDVPADGLGYSSFFIKHANNVRLSNMTISNSYKGHLIELAGVKGCIIEKCTLGGHTVGTGSKEAIQLDNTSGASATPSATPYDGTGCEDITIKNNSITYAGIGIGSHSAVYGHFHSNISICGNTMNTTGPAIKVISAYNMTISKNKLQNVGYGVVFRSSGTFVGDSALGVNTAYNLKVTSNTVANAKYSAFSLVGSSLHGVISGTTISSNTVSKSGYSAISLDLANGCTVTKNKVKKVASSMRNGIYLENSARNKLTYNTLSCAAGNGIQLSACERNYIFKNTIKSSGRNGIYLDRCTGGTEVKSNRISSVTRSGIAVENTSDAKVYSNTVSNAGKDKYLILLAGSTNTIVKNNSLSGRCSKPISEQPTLTAENTGTNVGNMDKPTLSGGAKTGRYKLGGKCDDYAKSVSLSVNGRSYSVKRTTSQIERNVKAAADGAAPVTETVRIQKWSSKSIIRVKKRAAIKVTEKDSGGNKYTVSYIAK